MARHCRRAVHSLHLSVQDDFCIARENFTVSVPVSILDRLASVIQERKTNPTQRSYTCKLLLEGVEKIGDKIVEEAQEVVDAAREPADAGREHLVREAADLVYHLLVMLAARDVELGQVEAELAQRFGISGLDEKASRVPH
jgi:phosphoribosyl-ATP pyrophosphohydrolase